MPNYFTQQKETPSTEGDNIILLIRLHYYDNEVVIGNISQYYNINGLSNEINKEYSCFCFIFPCHLFFKTLKPLLSGKFYLQHDILHTCLIV